MEKLKFFTLILTCLCITGTVFALEITDEQVIELVDKTCEDIKKDAQGTFDKIVNAKHPYKNAQNPALYVFVYNTQVVIVAHPNKKLVYRSFEDKTDVKGKKFRNQIVNGAVKNGSGWVSYQYKKPKKNERYKKLTYYKLVTGSDGNRYVVASGKYL